MNELQELAKEINELNVRVERQIQSLNTQRAVIDYLLDALEQLALEHDLEPVVEAIIQRIYNAEIKAEPSIIV